MYKQKNPLRPQCLLVAAMVVAVSSPGQLAIGTSLVAQEPATRSHKSSPAKKIKHIEKEIESLKSDVQKLRKQLGTLSKRGTALAIQDGTVLEYGSVILEAGRKSQAQTIRFSNVYDSPPLVIVCESGTAGSWVLVKSERITPTRAQIVVQDQLEYRCRIGYVVIGEGKLRAATKRAGGQKAKPTPQPGRKSRSKPITWRQYMRDCGTQAQQTNQARTEEVFRNNYKGKTVTWEGTVSHVTESLFGGSYLVMVKMSPSESIESDVALSVPKQFKQVVLSLKEGSVVRFTGVINRQGGAIMDHNLDVTAIQKKH